MAADLLDRDPTVSDDASPTLVRRTRVLRVFAARNRSGAWAYLDELGWRRVTAPTAAGSRDLLSALCRARLTGSEVAAEVTGTSVLAVTDDGGQAVVGLVPEPRLTGLTHSDRRRPDRHQDGA
jgi:hypothetical protein